MALANEAFILIHYRVPHTHTILNPPVNDVLKAKPMQKLNLM